MNKFLLFRVVCCFKMGRDDKKKTLHQSIRQQEFDFKIKVNNYFDVT